jgi:hypothetical protein
MPIVIYILFVIDIYVQLICIIDMYVRKLLIKSLLIKLVYNNIFYNIFFLSSVYDIVCSIKGINDMNNSSKLNNIFKNVDTSQLL